MTMSKKIDKTKRRESAKKKKRKLWIRNNELRLHQTKNATGMNTSLVSMRCRISRESPARRKFCFITRSHESEKFTSDESEIFDAVYSKVAIFSSSNFRDMPTFLAFVGKLRHDDGWQMFSSSRDVKSKSAA